MDNLQVSTSRVSGFLFQHFWVCFLRATVALTHLTCRACKVKPLEVLDHLRQHLLGLTAAGRPRTLVKGQWPRAAEANTRRTAVDHGFIES